MNISRACKRADEAGHSFIDGSFFQAFVVIVCILCDALTIKSIFETYIVDNIVMLCLIVIVLATILDTLPVLMASYLVEYRKTTNKASLIYFIVSIVGFFCEFALLFYLRWVTRFETIRSVQDVGWTNSVLTETKTALSASDKTAINAIALVLSFLPLLTSILAFLISIHEAPEAKKRRELLAAKRHISQQIGVLYGIRKELDKDWETELVNADTVMVESAKNSTRAIYDSEKERFRLRLARKLKRANALSYLTEDPIP